MNSEQQLKDLEEKYSLLLQAVHDMNDLIQKLRKENQELRDIVEDLENV